MNKTIAGNDTIWKICIYVRLSKEEIRKNKTESESIINQKSILLSWIDQYFSTERHTVYGIFEDDGISGTDDEREGFVRMLQVLEQQKANCVIVKSLSRAFRNYADQGYYLEEYFPSRRIRFISMMDTFVDTFKDQWNIYNLDVPMHGILNDRYAASTSHAVRKTLNDKRAKGKFIGAFPPWGFLKDPQDHNHLIVDPLLRDLICEIKDWLLYEGISPSQAAKRLNAMGVPNPLKYKQLKGDHYAHPFAAENDGMWTGSSLKKSILHPALAGHLVQGKQKVISYKIHEKINVKEEDWFKIQNTHEAIIAQSEYDALNELLKKKNRSCKRGKPHLFSGKIYCSKCRKALHRSCSGKHVYYKCRTKTEKGCGDCSVSIREDRLSSVVQKIMARLIELNIAEEGIPKDFHKSMKKTEIEKLQDERKNIRKKYKGIRNVYDELYTDLKLGNLTEEEYKRMRKNYKVKMTYYEHMQRELAEKGIQLQKEEETQREEAQRESILTELDRPAVVSFISRIEVGPNKKIKIWFSFNEKT